MCSIPTATMWRSATSPGFTNNVCAAHAPSRRRHAGLMYPPVSDLARRRASLPTDVGCVAQLPNCRRSRSFDLPGALLATIGLSCVTFWLLEWSSQRTPSPLWSDRRAFAGAICFGREADPLASRAHGTLPKPQFHWGQSSDVVSLWRLSATLFYLPLNPIQAYRVRYRWGYGPRDDQESEFGHSQRRSGWVTRRFV